MPQTSLYFKIKDSTALDKHKILEIFFKSWIDDACNNAVVYTLQEVAPSMVGAMIWEEIYRVDFDRAEDAIVIKLKGVPSEFHRYIEIIN